MQVILQGSLRYFPLGELLAFVAEHAGSATIEIDSKPSRACLVIDDGRLVWADSSHEREARAVLRDAAGWTAGTFRVLEGAVVPDGVTTFSLDLKPLVEELAKIRSDAAPFSDETTFAVSDDEKLEQVTLEPEELKLLISIGRGKTFGQLAGNRDRVELSRMIRKLAALDLVSPKIEERVDLDETARPKTRNFELSGSLTSTGADGLAYVLIEDEHIIGRDEANAVPIADSSVSSKHAKISRGNDGFYIEDLSSRNGTFVNGEKVTDRRLLVDNDVIRFGKVVMTFNVARELVRGRTTARGNPK